MSRPVIGCDIGGVVRNLIDDSPIKDSITTLNQLNNRDYKVYFISKCKDSYRHNVQNWLLLNGLEHFQTFFCLNYDDKIEFIRF